MTELEEMEGYILMATGARKYFEQAVCCARSLRHFDKARKICLVCDDPDQVLSNEQRFFDFVVVLDRPYLKGTEHHLYIRDKSPFERTLYVDSDCLATNRKLIDLWSDLRNYKVTFPGGKITTGVWRVDIEKIMEKFNAPYIVKLNGGVFYFDKSTESEKFFAVAQDLFEKHKEEVTVKHNTGGGYANEPIWGLTMALTGMDVFPPKRWLNVSTLQVEKWEISPEEPSVRITRDNHEMRPLITHFLGLGGSRCPNDLYRELNEIFETRDLG